MSKSPATARSCCSRVRPLLQRARLHRHLTLRIITPPAVRTPAHDRGLASMARQSAMRGGLRHKLRQRASLSPNSVVSTPTAYVADDLTVVTESGRVFVFGDSVLTDRVVRPQDIAVRSHVLHRHQRKGGDCRAGWWPCRATADQPATPRSGFRSGCTLEGEILKTSSWSMPTITRRYRARSAKPTNGPRARWYSVALLPNPAWRYLRTARPLSFVDGPCLPVNEWAAAAGMVSAMADTA